MHFPQILLNALQTLGHINSIELLYFTLKYVLGLFDVIPQDIVEFINNIVTTCIYKYLNLSLRWLADCSQKAC